MASKGRRECAALCDWTNASGVALVTRLALVVAFATLSGCATYNEELANIRVNADVGAYPQALEQLNGMLGVASIEESPDSWEGNRPLATLERAVLLQAEGEFALSARDLSGAETELELLDIGTDVAGEIGKYVYSDSSDDYVASPIERLALNGLNLANYLALGDLDGAAVEARRYTNMRDYLESVNLEAAGSFGAYLAGFTFERLGEGDRALRYYEEALEAGSLDSLVKPIARLASIHPYRGPRVRAALDAAGAPNGLRGDRPTEILTVFALGRVPHKEPKRIPVGAAVGIAGTWISGNADVLEYSILKVVVYPELVDSGYLAREASLTIDGQPRKIERVSSLGNDIRREYEIVKPRIVGSALSRMITRAVAAEGARLAGKQAGSAGGIIGLLAALATEGSLVALDRPDTRSWTFLPDQIEIARTPVSAGDHQLEVQIPGAGESRSITVTVPEGGFAVVVVTVPR
jgi:tetratricopeptide (TPR) repeat protein